MNRRSFLATLGFAGGATALGGVLPLLEAATIAPEVIGRHYHTYVMDDLVEVGKFPLEIDLDYWHSLPFSKGLMDLPARTGNPIQFFTLDSVRCT